MKTDTPDAHWIAGVRDVLLRHYDAHARCLPWRGAADPYAVWISEVMLQQTRVDAVAPYYERWVQRFPDIAALADAPLDDVLKAWEGLGYYSRARNLHRAARVLRERFNGALPADYETLRELPGVGEYTAGAVSSIAYGVRRPAIDGNVRRVLARLLDDPAPTTARLHTHADALVPHDRPGDFNQALMDLGATICTPRAPRCSLCPLTSYCAAYAAGTQRERPQPRRRTLPPLFLLATAVIRDARGRVLLARRPAHGLLAGMWCFPSREVADAAEAHDVAVEIAGSLLRDVGINSVLSLGDVDHAFSHRRDCYLCWLIDVAAADVELPDAHSWIAPRDDGYAIPRAQRKVIELILKTTCWWPHLRSE